MNGIQKYKAKSSPNSLQMLSGSVSGYKTTEMALYQVDQCSYFVIYSFSLKFSVLQNTFKHRQKLLTEGEKYESFIIRRNPFVPYQDSLKLFQIHLQRVNLAYFPAKVCFISQLESHKSKASLSCVTLSSQFKYVKASQIDQVVLFRAHLYYSPTLHEMFLHLYP